MLPSRLTRRLQVSDRFRNWQMRQWISEELPGMLCEYFHSTLDTRHVSHPAACHE